MMWISILLLLVILFFAFFLYINRQSSRKQETVADQDALAAAPVKPVILLIIDSLMDAPLREAIQLGKAPALQFLKEQGQYHPRVVTGFPTMSVCIDATLLTGTYPNQHHIFGLVYMDRQEQRMVNFGTSLMESLKFGVRTVLKDSLQHLNQTCLSREVKTIHEEYDGPTASINPMVYRGRHEHKLTAPWLGALTGIMPRTIATMAPRFFSFGALSKIHHNSRPTGPLHRFGFHDTFSRNELAYLLQSGQLPPFTIVYFPRNDEYVHQKGTSEIKGIIKADEELRELLNMFPSWDEALDHVTLIVMGDSGQAPIIPNRKEAYIDLRKRLKEYRIMPIRQKKPRPKDQLVICCNERMAYIYVQDEQLDLKEVISVLKQEPKLDIIAWNEEGLISCVSGQTEGKFSYKAGGAFVDEYDQTWHLVGDLAILDLTVNERNQIQYGIFPDVMARLAGVMDTSERVIVVTVSPGYEMISEASPTHVGASHGSLHHLDSLVPMIIGGTDSQPAYPRVINLKSWLLELMHASRNPKGDS
ncbi:alkaline phosphatase family protein [Laceyella putida]|uniref:Alkaline phosphatase family protein n=1 Tax=Laceyella putida TaxID=110101 RepID=A0ABW2RK79_9BACL